VSNTTAHAIILLITDALMFWGCWDIPHPYFFPAFVALAMLNRIHSRLIPK
jgi:hypothetical protein